MSELEKEILKLKGELMVKGYKSKYLDKTILKLYSIMDGEKLSKELQYRIVHEMLKMLEAAPIKIKKKRTRSNIYKNIDDEINN